MDAKGRGPAHQDKKGHKVKGRPHEDGEITPAVRVIVAPGVACTAKVEDLLVKIVGEHKSDKQDGHNPQRSAVAATQAVLLQTRKAQTTQLVEQRNERHGHVVQVPQHGGIERRERLVLENDFDHPQGADGGDGNKTAAQHIVQTAQIDRYAPDRKCNCGNKQRQRARMDERIHDLFGHLAIGGHGVRKFGVEGEQRRQDCQKHEEHRGDDTGDSKDAVAVHLMCYANKESRHGEEPAAPGIRHGCGSGGRVADMSLAGTHSAFSVPTDGSKKRAACPKIRRRQGARQPPPSGTSRYPPAPNHRKGDRHLCGGLGRCASPR